MPLEQHEEREYSKDGQKVFAAALNAVETLQGNVVKQSSEENRLDAKFPKTILGKTLGERTFLSCAVQSQGEKSKVIVDAYPLDALERKLMFGARKGVTETVVTWYLAHLEHHLGKAE